MSETMNIDMTGGAAEDNTPVSNDAGISIDITSGSNELVIDSTADSTPNNVVDLSTLKGNNRAATNRPARKQQQPIIVNANTNTRRTVNVSEIAKPEEPDPNIKESIEDEILNLNDPNSIFSKYIKKQKEEMEEWVAAKEEEKEINAITEEDQLIADLTGDYSDINNKVNNKKEEEAIVYDINSGWHDKGVEPEKKVAKPVKEEKPTEVESVDISSIFNNEEENKPMSEPKKEVLDELIPDMPAEAKTVKAQPVEEVDINIEPEPAIVKETPVVVKEEVKDVESLDINSAATKEVKKEEKPEVAPLEMEITTDVSTFNVSEIVEEDEIDEDAQAKKEAEEKEETLKHLQKLATEKLKPISKKLDISSFTILKKPVIDVKHAITGNNARVIKWVLPYQESTVFMKEFSGSELEKLREYSNAGRSADALNRRFKLIYDHIASPKPATFEAWMKSTPFSDVDHYFFAIYISSFKGANYLPEDCPNKDCTDKTFITDDVDIMKMVKFDTEEAKKKFSEIYQSEATPAGKGLYCTEAVALNEKIAVSFREPSIANLADIATLDERAIDRFSAIIEYIPYIDGMYLIDVENQQLAPISYKMFADNPAKTVISKIAKYESLLSTLSVDEFGIIKAYINAISEKTAGISYVYPSVNCPTCGAVTNEIPTTAEELVFTRYQLGALTTTPLK
jgi:hypothetical protein